MKERKVIILPAFYISAAAAIMLIPFSWLVSWFLAALIHELFHVAAVYAFGYRIEAIQIGAGGAVIKTNMESGWKNGICSLAGPIGGLLLLGLIRLTPRLALCGLIQSVYNLLPIMPLDGACAIRCLLGALFKNTYVYWFNRIIEFVVMVLLIVLAWYGFIKFHLGLFPLITVILLFLRNKKIPCKRWLLAVQ